MDFFVPNDGRLWLSDLECRIVAEQQASRRNIIPGQ